MDFTEEEDFTFECAPFPPNTLIEDEILPNKTIQTVINCIVSLPTDSSSPFVTLAVSLPHPINNDSTANSKNYMVSVPGLLDNEVEHAKQVLKLFPSFSEVRRRIVPRFVNDEKFWQAYFTLLAIQTRYETRQNVMFGGAGGGVDENGDEDNNNNHQNDNNNNNLKQPTQNELAMMSARIVLRMPTPSLVQSPDRRKKQQGQQQQQDSTNTNNNNNTIDRSNNNSSSSPNRDQNNGNNNSSDIDNNSTRIVPGRRLRVPPSLCITVRDASTTGSSSSSSSSSGPGATATMLMGKDLMTKHMRDEWRRCLNDMCEYEV